MKPPLLLSGAFLVLLILVHIANCQSNQLMKCKEIVQEICLGKEAAKLRAEIEKRYKKKIKIVFDEKEELGRALVLPDGTPQVILNPSVKSVEKERQEERLAHELYHLKLRLEGYGQFDLPPNFDYPEGQAGFYESMGTFLSNAAGDGLFSVLEHFIYFPIMRQHGMQPSLDVNDGLRKVLEELKNNRGQVPRVLFTLNYLRAHLESDDLGLIADYQNWYSTHRNVAYRLGERLLTTIRAMNTANPRSPVETGVECLNILYEGKARFTIQSWATCRRGKVLTPIAKICISIPGIDETFCPNSQCN